MKSEKLKKYIDKDEFMDDLKKLPKDELEEIEYKIGETIIEEF